MQNVTWLKSLQGIAETSARPSYVPRERFRMTARQGRHGDGERGTACHKITISMMAIMEITTGNRPNRRRTRNQAYTLGHASTVPGKSRGDDSRGNFHFIIPLLSSFGSLLEFSPLPSSLCTTSETTCADS